MTTKPKAKNIFASKVFWTNVVVLVANFAEVIPFPYVTEGLAIANIILRILTKQPVKMPDMSSATEKVSDIKAKVIDDEDHEVKHRNRKHHNDET